MFDLSVEESRGSGWYIVIAVLIFNTSQPGLEAASVVLTPRFAGPSSGFITDILESEREGSFIRSGSSCVILICYMYMFGSVCTFFVRPSQIVRPSQMGSATHFRSRTEC